MNPSPNISITPAIVFFLALLGAVAFFTQPKTNTLEVKYNEIATTGENKYRPTIRLLTKDNQFFCSGVVIDGQYALTAAHCIDDIVGTEYRVKIQNDAGEETGVEALAVSMDEYRDVGLIAGNFKDFAAAEVDFVGKDMWLGMPLKSCGFPSGEDLFCTELIHTGNYLFQYRTLGGPIYKGMSGGPVYNAETGKVVGVNSAVSEANVIIAPLIGVRKILGL